MNSKVYKCCAVPQCKNTSIKTPNKLFVFVPHKKNIRYKWLKLARRDSTAILPSTQLYFCEDHFDLPNDMENYMEYHLMGSVSQVRMKPGCMPTKFQCQPDRRKRTSNATERPYILKKQRKTLIEECEQDLKERTIASKQLELGETSSGSLADPGLGPGDVPEVCRTCLATGVRMYDVAARGLHDTFETVTGTQLLTSEQRPTQVCYVCWSQLQRFRAFCQMSRRADAYMTQLLSEGKQITEQDVSMRHQLIKQNLDVTKFPLTAIHTQEDPEECAFAEVKNKVKVENISDSETESGSETGICMRELETNESDERLESMVGVEIKVEEEDIDIEEFDPFKDLEQNTVRHETGLQCSEEGNLTSQKPLRSRKKRSFRLTAPKRSRKDRAGKKTKIKHSSGEISSSSYEPGAREINTAEVNPPANSHPDFEFDSNEPVETFLLVETSSNSLNR